MLKKKKPSGKWILWLAIYALFCLMLWCVRISHVHVRYQMAAESTGDMTFIAKCNSIDAVSISFDDMNSPLCAVRLEVYDSNEHLCGAANVEEDAEAWTSFAVRTLLFNKINLIPGQRYHVKVMNDTGDLLNNVSVLLCGGSANVLPAYIFFCILIASVLALLYNWYQTENFHLKRSFILIMVLLGLLSSLGIKPMNAPDEATHFAQAYALSSRILGRPATIEADGKPMILLEQSGLLREANTFSADETYFFYTDTDYGNDKIAACSARYMEDPHLAWYSYIPGAAGITVARLLHLPYQAVLLSGRISSILFLSLMAILAMWLYPTMQMAVAAICLLPKTIWIGATCSYDVWNLAFILIYLSLLFRIREQQEGVRLQDLLALFVSFGLFVPVKFVYGILGLAIFMIPDRQWRKHKGVRAVLVIVIIAAFVLLVISRGREAASYLFTSNMDRRGFNTTDTSESYTIPYVLHHPARILMTYVESIFTYGPYYIWQLASGHYLRDYVPHSLAFLVMLVFGFIMITALPVKVNKKLRIETGLLFLLGIFIIETTYLFAYSVVPDYGIGLIEGVQGRYFIPFLYLLPFCMHRDHFVFIQPGGNCRGNTATLLTGSMIVLDLMIILMKTTAVFADASLLIWGGTAR